MSTVYNDLYKIIYNIETTVGNKEEVIMKNTLNIVISKEPDKIEISGHKNLSNRFNYGYNHDFEIIFYNDECQYFMTRTNYASGNRYLHKETVRYGLFKSHRDLLELIQAELEMLYPGEGYNYFNTLFREEVSVPLCTIVNNSELYRSTIEYYSVKGIAVDDVGGEGDFTANFTQTGIWVEYPYYDDDYEETRIIQSEDPLTYFHNYAWIGEIETPYEWIYRSILDSAPFKFKNIEGQDGVKYDSIEVLAQKIASTIVPIHWGK